MHHSLEEHKQQYIGEFYLHSSLQLPGIMKYTDRCGWDDYYIHPHTLFSRRRVFYDIESFPDKLHSHGFYEIVIFLGGTVSYVSEKQIFNPQYGDIMIFPPECEHTVRSSKDGIYDRIVLHVEPMWFQVFAGGYIPALFLRKNAGCYFMQPEHVNNFLEYVAKLEESVTAEAEDSAMLAQGLIAHILVMLGRYAQKNRSSATKIPQRLVDIKEYIDANFTSIAAVDELSTMFYYSREHICRLFKDYYKITPSEYLHRKKIEYARQALQMGCTVRYAFDISGFRSYSAFIKAFRQIVGTPPGKYRRIKDEPV